MLRLFRYVVLIILIASFGLLPLSASAHERRDLGPYELTVGFTNEPAFEGEQNGVEILVKNKETGAPVEGLADTLKAEVLKGSQRMPLELRAAYGEKGHYVSNFYPTEAGAYTFHFTGTIENTPIDEQFTSSPDGFSEVEATSALQFPAKVASSAELSAQVAAAENTARIATIVGGAGLACGLIGLALAALALRGRNRVAAGEPRVART